MNYIQTDLHKGYDLFPLAISFWNIIPGSLLPLFKIWPVATSRKK